MHIFLQVKNTGLGVTNNLARRVYEHKIGMIDGFTKTYNVKILVYYEVHNTMYQAITAEKKIKGYLRKTKIKKIEEMNKNWNDLYDSIKESFF